MEDLNNDSIGREIAVLYQSSGYHAPVVNELGNRPSFLRLVRWIAAGLLIALGLTLGATSLSGYRVVRGALETVVQGQAEALLQVTLRATQHGARAEEGRLKAVLKSESARGLRCVVMFEYVQDDTQPQKVRAQARVAVGDCLTRASDFNEIVLKSRHDPPTAIGDRIRLVLGPPPMNHRPPGLQPSSFVPPPGPPWPQPPGGSDSPAPAWPGPPTASDDGDDPRGGKPPEGPPESRPLLLEFVPQMAEALSHSATRTLFSGGIAMLALLFAAVVFWRLSLREERVYATLEQKRQLASLGEMAAVLAHELRNPLAALKGHAQLLLEQLPEGSRPHGKAARVVSESERLEALSEDLLSFVRTTVLAPQDVNPRDLLAECVAAAADPRIEVDSSHAPPRWRLDPQRIQQVLGNLLRNALEASPADAKVKSSVGLEGKELVFRIRDHSSGIREEDVERIFEPFYTTRARGTGLGLAIVRRLVSLHGGRITVKNASDGGALFTVRIPKELP